jgi:hypothetical protein
MNEELKNNIKQSISEIVQDNKIPCIKALKIAEDFDVPPIQVGKIINQMKVKVGGCQLGCFK